MKLGGTDLGKVALVFGMVAFQLHILTMTVSTIYGVRTDNLSIYADRGNHKHNVIQAFLIIAYLLYILSLLLLLVLSYSNLKGNKAISVITAIILFLAASSVIVGLAVYDAEAHSALNYRAMFSSYKTTTYTTAAASGYVSCVVLLVSLCV